MKPVRILMALFAAVLLLLPPAHAAAAGPTALVLTIDDSAVLRDAVAGERVELPDGAVEEMDPSGEMFGFERLEKVLTDLADLEPTELCRKTIEEVRRFSGRDELADDVTMVAARMDPGRV